CSAENLSVAALNNNQLAGYGYDAAGNMTSDPTDGVTSVYDQENRITGVNGYTYTYDADGNRVKKSNGSTGTLYWYMSPGIVAESDLVGNLQSEYVFFDAERVARRDGVNGAGGVFYYFSDHLKTASVITDAAGKIQTQSDYYPWGGELQLPNDMAVASSSFEGGAADGWWLGYWGATSSVEGIQAHSGGYSLAQTGSVSGGTFQDVCGLVPGSSYQISVWVMSATGTTAQAYLWLHDTTGANAQNTTPATPGQNWQQLLLTYIANSTGCVRMHLHYAAGAGTIYYDDVQILAPAVTNFANHYKFTGKERDSETNLDYFGARYYSNGLGRWVTPDWAAKATAVPYAEFSDPQSLNLYSYVRNVPTTRFDADGHDTYFSSDKAEQEFSRRMDQ